MTLLQALEERATAYELLHALYSYPVTRQTLEMLAGATTDDVGIDKELHALQAMLAGDLDELSEAVNVEHTGLFEGPGHAPAPPYGSFWLDGGVLMGPETLAVRRAYLQWNTAPAETVHLAEDHVSLELAFLGYLSRRAHAALAAGNEERCARLLEAETRFLEQHVLAWVPRFCAAVISSTPDSFFARVCRLTSTILDADRSWSAEPGQRIVENAVS